MRTFKKFSFLVMALFCVLGLSACDNSPSQEHEHQFEFLDVGPTCEEDGYFAERCTTCGYYHVITIYNKRGHDYDERFDHDGDYHYHTCSYCGKIEELLPHVFDTTDYQPSYENKGHIDYFCSICGYSKTEYYAEQLVHSFNQNWSYDETKHWKTCEDLGYSYLKADEGAHSFVDTIVSPTATENGYTSHTCQICGYSFIDSITAKLSYTVTWKNWDGTILEVDYNVLPGSIPSFDGEDPVKAEDDEFVYIWEGNWSAPLTNIYSDMTFTAKFSKKKKTYLSKDNFQQYLVVTSNENFTGAHQDIVKKGTCYNGVRVQGNTSSIAEGYKFYNVAVTLHLKFRTYYKEVNIAGNYTASNLWIRETIDETYVINVNQFGNAVFTWDISASEFHGVEEWIIRSVDSITGYVIEP